MSDAKNNSILRRDVASWDDYSLLDSGNQMKLERFGKVTVARPEPQALWSPENPDAWRKAQANFSQRGEEGTWQVSSAVSEDWQVHWQDLRFGLRLMTFKHTGVFPEQAANWAYLRSHLGTGMQMLNLFGYTGGATLAGLSAGASVTHVDASRPAIIAGKNNAALSGLADKPVRWIEDDAMVFVQREVRRERSYDCIVMDPPAFGHGPKKEVWRFEDGLLPLLKETAKILKPGGLLLVNAYSMGFPAIAVEQAVRDVFPQATSIESVELVLPEQTPRGFLLPAGITVRMEL